MWLREHISPTIHDSASRSLDQLLHALNASFTLLHAYLHIAKEEMGCCQMGILLNIAIFVIGEKVGGQCIALTIRNPTSFPQYHVGESVTKGGLKVEQLWCQRRPKAIQ